MSLTSYRAAPPRGNLGIRWRFFAVRDRYLTSRSRLGKGRGRAFRTIVTLCAVVLEKPYGGYASLAAGRDGRPGAHGDRARHPRQRPRRARRYCAPGRRARRPRLSQGDETVARLPKLVEPFLPPRDRW